MELTGVVAAGVLEVVALALAIGLWRGRERVISKVLWTVVLVVPLFGIIAYALLHAPSPPSDPIDRPPDRPDYWGGISDPRGANSDKELWSHAPSSYAPTLVHGGPRWSTVVHRRPRVLLTVILPPATRVLWPSARARGCPAARSGTPHISSW